MKKVMTTTAVAVVAATSGWAGTAGAQVSDSCVLNSERFIALDRDADGFLSEQEYMACTDASASETRQALQDQFATIDRDRDAKITKTEAEQFVAEAPQGAGAPPTDAGQPAEQAAAPQPAEQAAAPQQDQRPASDQPQTAQQEQQPAAPDQQMQAAQQEQQPAASGPQPAMQEAQQEQQPAAQQPAPVIPTPPMGQREVTSGPLAPPSGGTAGTQQPPTQSAPSAESRVAAVPPPSTRSEADPKQWQPLIGAKITNLAGESLGEFSRLVVNQSGEHAAVVESGGFLGFGANEYVVPLQQLQVQDDRVVLNMPKQDLKQLPKFEESEWKDAPK